MAPLKHNQFGFFTDTPAGYRITKKNTPLPWEYIFTNQRLLLRIRQDGAANLQLDPPGGPSLFTTDRNDPFPAFLVWFKTPGDKNSARFTNYGHLYQKDKETLLGTADKFTCDYSPDSATWQVQNGDWSVSTRISLPGEDKALLAMELTITNTSKKQSKLDVLPTLKPAMSPPSSAPWDMLHLYQSASFFQMKETVGAWYETRDPGGVMTNRWRTGFLSDFPATHFEMSLRDWVGHGYWNYPESLDKKTLNRTVTPSKYSLKTINSENSVVGQQMMTGLQATLGFNPGESKSYTFLFGLLPYTPGSTTPSVSDFKVFHKYLSPALIQKDREKTSRQYHQWFGQRFIQSPDTDFDRYVNQWLPLQLEWVGKLDRGWPTGMRGVRDSAQDVNGLLYWDEALAKQRLLELYACQRTDGWFPRQYSVNGPDGKHDLRDYVDSGLWVWELTHDYLAQTGDNSILQEQTRWLDNTKQNKVLTHWFQILEYYLNPDNIGPHGLCKIRHGDWNDSVNKAGLEGIGESVMVSCQVVMALEQAAEVLESIPSLSKKYSKDKFIAAAEKFRKNIIKYALNKKGFFNGVYSDAKRWVFSDKDPDGKTRVNGPVNSFAVISKVVPPKDWDKLFKHLNGLKGPYGWRLYYPALGNPPVEKLGRVGTGDLAAGLAENGTPYNHGAQGFLARAAAVAGKGNLLFEIFQYMLPYNLEVHPVESTKTAPYAVVNHYKEAPGIEGEGGDPFLSGTISTALRNVYQGMIGFRPTVKALVLDPCIPELWPTVKAELSLRGARYQLTILNPNKSQSGVNSITLDGKPLGTSTFDKSLNRTTGKVDYSHLPTSGTHQLVITLS